MTNIDDLAADIREVDGENNLGAGALAEALIAKGWSKPAPAPEFKDLKDYKSGDPVIVLSTRDYKEHEGRVSEMDRNGVLHVDTDRGPVSIMNKKNVRPQ